MTGNINVFDPPLMPTLITMAVAVTVIGYKKHVDPPLFAIFKKFCVETGGAPEGFKKAVQEVGGNLAAPSESRMGVSELTYHMVGEDMQIYVRRYSGNAHIISDNCTIYAFRNDVASVEAIRNWVGVPPDTITYNRLSEGGPFSQTGPAMA